MSETILRVLYSSGFRCDFNPEWSQLNQDFYPKVPCSERCRCIDCQNTVGSYVKYSLSSITAAYQEEGSHDNEEDEEEELTPSVNLSRIDMKGEGSKSGSKKKGYRTSSSRSSSNLNAPEIHPKLTQNSLKTNPKFTPKVICRIALQRR